ncbi:MAG: hypothetical protein HY724_05510 [Candidatus Rokubacteria bacterium]|nr:hypothetical protein [Candidatus Rokubacteria bacterium]
MMVLLKLGLLAFVPFAWEHRLPILLGVVAVASVGSHMPARFRHTSALSALAATRAKVRIILLGMTGGGYLLSKGLLGKGERI